MSETAFEKSSGNVFAYLGFSPEDAEELTGAKRPSGMALKLVTIVQKHGLQVLG